MKQAEDLCLNVHGCVVFVRSNDSDFIDFCRLFLHYFERKLNGGDCEPHVVSTVTFPFSRAFQPSKLIDLCKLGTNVYVGPNSLYLQDKLGLDLTILYEGLGPGSTRLLVDATFTMWSLRNLLRRVLKPRVARYQFYMHVMRQVTYYPLFYWLAQTKGIGVIHAASVTNRHGACVLCGLNGVGKTGLAYYLLQNGFKLVSDNFLLVGEGWRSIYAFPEAIRLSPEMAQKFGIPISRSTVVHGKFLIEAPSSLIESVAPPRMIMFLSRGTSFALRRITGAKMANRIGAMQAFVKETPEYSFIRLLSAFTNSGDAWEYASGNAILELRDVDIPCYSLTLPDTSCIEERYGVVKQAITEVIADWGQPCNRSF